MRHGAPHRPLWAQPDHGVLRLPVAADQSLMDLWSRPSRRLPQYDRQRGKYLGVPHLSVERASRGTKAPGRQLLFLPRCLTGSLWIPVEFAAQTQKTKECLRVTPRSCGKFRMKGSTSQLNSAPKQPLRKVNHLVADKKMHSEMLRLAVAGHFVS